MSKFIIYDDSKNYTAQVVSLPSLQKVDGLDNLVRVNIQGNDCLIGRDTDVDELHLFFPAETQLSEEFACVNNLYRHSELNINPEKKGFFEDNRRVKALKFKGIISTGFVIPVSSLYYLGDVTLRVGDEFNAVGDREICKKYVRKFKGPATMAKQAKLLDQIVDSRLAPEHFDTQHLLRNVEKLHPDDNIVVTHKLHGISARYYHTLTHRILPWYEKLLRKIGVKIQEDEYRYICASRRVIKSIDFKTLDGKNHYYDSDLWSQVGEEYFKDRLFKGEAVYCEIIGTDYSCKAIQHGYTYGLTKPKVYVYRISYINPQGTEIDLTHEQMVQRCEQIGVEPVPILYSGTLHKFLSEHDKSWHPALAAKADHRDISDSLNESFYNKLLENPSILDSSVPEEGFCIRKNTFPRPEVFKIKSKAFLIKESKSLDSDIVDVESEN